MQYLKLLTDHPAETVRGRAVEQCKNKQTKWPYNRALLKKPTVGLSVSKSMAVYGSPNIMAVQYSAPLNIILKPPDPAPSKDDIYLRSISIVDSRGNWPVTHDAA
jgi:hypothetical protein